MPLSSSKTSSIRSLSSGFTIVELLVAILVGSVLATSIVSVFIHQTRVISLQEDLADLEQNLRIGMDILSRDVRMAGLYTAKEITPFDVGDIDCNGDGVHGDCRSEGTAGGPHAVAVLLSEDQGLEIVSSSPGAQVNIYFCTDGFPLDPPGLPTGTTSLTFSDSSSFGGWDIVNNKISLGVGGCPDPCPTGMQCSNITFPSSTAGAFTPAVGGHIWGDIVYLAYSIGTDYDCDGDVDGDPALIRQSDGVCSVVAFGVNDLEVVYVRDNGPDTINEAFLDTVTKQSHIDSVRLTLSGETRNEHSISNEIDKKPKRRMTTEVRIRNLHL